MVILGVVTKQTLWHSVLGVKDIIVVFGFLAKWRSQIVSVLCLVFGMEDAKANRE